MKINFGMLIFLCFADLMLAVNAQGHDSNRLIYTWVKSFCGFNTDIGGLYHNRQTKNQLNVSALQYKVCAGKCEHV